MKFWMIVVIFIIVIMSYPILVTSGRISRIEIFEITLFQLQQGLSSLFGMW